jgi:hypothetical protein
LQADIEPLHAVDKLNAIFVELSTTAINRPRFVTKCEKPYGGDLFMVEQRNVICHAPAMPHGRDQTAVYEKAIRNENVFKLEWPGSHRPELP